MHVKSIREDTMHLFFYVIVLHLWKHATIND